MEKWFTDLPKEVQGRLIGFGKVLNRDNLPDRMWDMKYHQCEGFIRALQTLGLTDKRETTIIDYICKVAEEQAD